MKMNIDTVMFRPHPVGKAGQLIQFFPPPPPSMLELVLCSVGWCLDDARVTYCYAFGLRYGGSLVMPLRKTTQMGYPHTSTPGSPEYLWAGYTSGYLLIFFIDIQSRTPFIIPSCDEIRLSVWLPPKHKTWGP